MLLIVFKGLDRSEFLKQLCQEKMDQVIERFPKLKHSKVTITLTMENSPFKAGKDYFSAKFHCQSGKYRNVLLKKNGENLIFAFTDLLDHLLERLNRYGDRNRVRRIKMARISHNRISWGV